MRCTLVPSSVARWRVLAALVSCALRPPTAAQAAPPSFEVVGQSLRGYAASLLMDGTRAYVMMGSALVVFDVANPAAPKELGRAYSQNCFDGAPALAKFAGGTYLLAPSDLFGVRIFDVTDPSHPHYLSSVFHPPASASVDSGGGVFVQGDLLFQASGGRGLKIYRAQLSKTGALLGYDPVGQYPKPENPYLVDYCTNVYVEGTTAYVAARTKGLIVLDVSYPSAPVLLGQYPGSLSKTTWSVRPEGKMAIVSNGIVLSGCGVETVSVADPKNPTQLACFTNNNTFDAFRNISRDGSLVAVSAFVQGLFMFEIPPDGSNIKLVARWSDTKGLSMLSMKLPHVYVADALGGLRIVDHQGTSAIAEVGHAAADWARDVVIVDHTAYLADGSRGVAAVDVQNPSAPGTETIVSAAGELEVGSAIAQSGAYLYVADDIAAANRGKLAAYTHSGTAPLHRVSTVDIAGDPTELIIEGDTLFVAGGSGGVFAFQLDGAGGLSARGMTTAAGTVSRVEAFEGKLYALSESGTVSVLSPKDLSLLGHFDTGVTRSNDIAWKRVGGTLYAYVACTGWANSKTAAIKVLDVSDPAAIVDLGWKTFTPTLTFGMGAPQTLKSIEVLGERLFVVHENDGLFAFDLSDPANPTVLTEYLLSANNNTYELIFRDGYFYNAHGDAGLYVFQYHEDGAACTAANGCAPAGSATADAGTATSQADAATSRASADAGERDAASTPSGSDAGAARSHTAGSHSKSGCGCHTVSDGRRGGLAALGSIALVFWLGRRRLRSLD